MSERGEYRPIYTVLVHGADYQRLTPEAKLVLLHCKLVLGASGIGVLYVAALAEQTGLAEQPIRMAFDSLSDGGWIRVERNVVWVVRGLEYEPSLSVANPNHRKWLRTYLAGLPNLALVNEFRSRYADWLGTENGMGSDTHADAPRITTTTTTTNTSGVRAGRAQQKGTGSHKRTGSAPKYPHFASATCDRLYAAWSALGRPAYAEFRGAFGPLFPEKPLYTVEQLEAAISAFIEDAKAEGKPQFATPKKFVSQVQHYVDLTTPISQRDPSKAWKLGVAS